MLEVSTSMPKTKKGLHTFNKICMSAEKLFHEKTYHAATINDIVNDANLGVGTFYIYFDSKRSLYRHLVLSYYHDIRKSIAEKTKDCKTRLECEKIGLRTFLDYVIKKPHAYTIIWQSLLVDRELFVDYYTSFAERYKKQLDESIEKGEVNPEIDTIALAYALMGISNFVGLETIFFHTDVLDEKRIDQIVDSVIIMLEKGIEN